MVVLLHLHFKYYTISGKVSIRHHPPSTLKWFHFIQMTNLRVRLFVFGSGYFAGATHILCLFWQHGTCIEEH